MWRCCWPWACCSCPPERGGSRRSRCNALSLVRGVLADDRFNEPEDRTADDAHDGARIRRCALEGEVSEERAPRAVHAHAGGQADLHVSHERAGGDRGDTGLERRAGEVELYVAQAGADREIAWNRADELALLPRKERRDLAAWNLGRQVGGDGLELARRCRRVGNLQASFEVRLSEHVVGEVAGEERNGTLTVDRELGQRGQRCRHCHLI